MDINTPTNKRRTILVVDDEPDITSTLKISLEDNGFIVHAFNNPLLALENFRKRLYDLFILDIKMPQMNGFQLYQKLREIDAAIKVCFITAFEAYYRAVKEEFRDLDIKCFIKKPITCDGLIIRLKAELEIQ